MIRALAEALVLVALFLLLYADVQRTEDRLQGEFDRAERAAHADRVLGLRGTGWPDPAPLALQARP